MLDSIKQKLEQINLIDKTKYKKAGVLIILLEDERDGEYKLLFQFVLGRLRKSCQWCQHPKYNKRSKIYF